MYTGSVAIGAKNWYAWIATTTSEIASGLGGQLSLPSGSGMLFSLPTRQRVTVTTVPMLFNLDIAFIKDGVVSQIEQDVAPGRSIPSDETVDSFFEVNAGDLDGIIVGDAVSTEVYSIAQQTDTTSIMMTQMMTVIIVVVMMSVVMGMFKTEEVYGCSQQVIDGSVIHFQTEIDEAFRQAISLANR